jgi:hypothetical protein
VASRSANETSRRMQAGAVQNFSTQGKVRTDDAWTVECPDGISCRPDGCKGSDFFDLESVQNLLETYL